MYFKELANDRIILQKSNGHRIENIMANVQPNLIFIDDASIPIEEGDRILRVLPNKLTESYIVLDRGFYSGINNIRSHYQVKVRKETTNVQPSSQKTDVNNFFGDVVNTQIQQDVKNSQQSQTITYDEQTRARIIKYLKKLEDNVDQVGLDEGNLRIIKDNSCVLEHEVTKQNSSPGIVKEAFATIRNILEGATGSLIAAGLLYEMSRIF